MPADKIAPKPVLGWPSRRAAEEENTSGAPFPRAKRVTAPIDGERERWEEREVTENEK